HVPKERGSASAASPASTSLTPNVASQLSMSLETPAKQAAMTDSSLAGSTGLELSTLQQFGTEDNSDSAEHNGSKERFTQADADGGQPALTPVIPSLSSQSVSTPARTTPPAVVEAPTVAPHPESPLPTSVRFEVQPGDMGRIRVHLSVVDHTVYTNVMTERVEAHDFLVRNSERFEAGLGAHGLEVGRFQVDVQSQARQHGDRGGTGWSQDDVHRRNPQSSEQPAVDRHAGDREPDWMDRMINVFA
ncbi:MAG: flagellar hook-length control protein FliK, partial [Nitrospirota bacterium]|nr:flagellar hook-length control protein FliK [Nitrospirota bacterium]